MGGARGGKYRGDLTHCPWFPDFAFTMAAIMQPLGDVLRGLKGRLTGSPRPLLAVDGQLKGPGPLMAHRLGYKGEPPKGRNTLNPFLWLPLFFFFKSVFSVMMAATKECDASL